MYIRVTMFCCSSRQSWCLDSYKPKIYSHLKFPDKLPGQLYDADTQCKWQYDASATLCTYDFAKVHWNYIYTVIVPKIMELQ